MRQDRGRNRNRCSLNFLELDHKMRCGIDCTAFVTESRLSQATISIALR